MTEEIFLDVETTTHNKGHPFDPRNKLVSYVVDDSKGPVFKYFTDPDFGKRIVVGVWSNRPTIVGFNAKFDLHWLGNRIDLDEVDIWDCQLAEFVYSGQKDRLLSLDETLARYGLDAKKSNLVHGYWAAGIQTDEIPVDILKEYNLGDVQPLKALYHIQQKLLSQEQANLVRLLGEDMKVLMEMERKGIKFDIEAATKKIQEILSEVEEHEKQLKEYLPGIEHSKFNWDSGDQLSAFLYGGRIAFPYALESQAAYKSGPKKGESYTKREWFTETVYFPQRFKPLKDTEVKKTRENGPEGPHYYQVDEPTLKQLVARRKEDKNVLALLMERSRKIKVAEMLQSILDQFQEKHWSDGCIHPQYNQNIVITGRLSSSAPNMQNQPPEVDEFLVSKYD